MTAAERQSIAREMYARRPRPSMREIADELGVSVGTIHRDLNPKAAKRYRTSSREYKRDRRKQTNQRR